MVEFNMEDFTWERLSFCFPEWAVEIKTGKKEDIWKDFTSPPSYENGVINFLFNKHYGAQLFLSHKIPDWLGDKRIDIIRIREVYQELCKLLWAKAHSVLVQLKINKLLL